MKVIETERLILRPFELTDAADVFEYAKNPHVGDPAGWRAHRNRAESEEIVRQFMADSDEIFAVVLKENNKAIGSIGLHEDSHRINVKNVAMVGYVLSETYWGKGLIPEGVKALMRYAFFDRGCELLSVMHFTGNERSRRVIEKCGFKREGLLRKVVTIYDGRVMDEVFYSITKEEFISENA